MILIYFSQSLRRLEAVYLWHLQIHEDKAVSHAALFTFQALLGLIDAILAVFCDVDELVESVASVEGLEKVSEAYQIERFIIYDENPSLDRLGFTLTQNEQLAFDWRDSDDAKIFLNVDLRVRLGLHVGVVSVGSLIRILHFFFAFLRNQTAHQVRLFHRPITLGYSLL